MSEIMTFPETVEEFMEQYKVVDTEKVYTSGIELVPIFRMKQWFEHLPAVPHEMSAREYHNIAKRMLKTDMRAFNMWWDSMRWLDGDKALAFAEKWAREHPEKKRKTYKEDYLEKFPNVQMRFDEEQTMSRPVGCRMNIYGIEGPCTGRNCFSCWNEEMEGEDDF